MVIFYSVIIGLINWIFCVIEERELNPLALNGFNPIPVIAFENRSSIELYNEYDTLTYRADA